MRPTKGTFWEVPAIGLGLFASICVLTVPSSGHSADKGRPVFSEIPAATSPRVPTPVLNAGPNPVPTAENPPPVIPPPPTAPTVPAEEQGREKTLYSFQATDLDLRSALAAFARANNLNIIPDNDVVGTVTLDIRDLPLNQMMRALL